MNTLSNSVKWVEEVQLSDGRIIVIERETLREGGGDEWVSNRSGTKPKEYRILFNYPDGQVNKIEWRSTKNSPSTWPESPLILDLEAGVPTIYTIVHISDACEIYSKYFFKDGIWLEAELPDIFEERATNLLLRDGVDMPTHVDLNKKHKFNNEIGYRKSLKKVGPKRKVCG